MQLLQDRRALDLRLQRALAGRGLEAKMSEDDATAPIGQARPNDPCAILRRLAQTIQLMRLDHTDAHLYRNGCDALVMQAVEASTWSGLAAALAHVTDMLEQGDYHNALMALRTVSLQDWHAC